MAASSTAPTPPTILRRPKVEARTGLSCSTIYELVAAGAFPRPVRLGARTVGWIEREVDDWIVQKIAASRARTAA